MTRKGEQTDRGAALITVLILASAIAIVVIGLFAIRGRDIELSGKSMHQTSATLGERSAFAAASALLESLTVTDDYLVSATLH
ncbi:MAG: hypothetical protein AAF357_19745, partial [Verrucomicrobiota bacterium]